MSHRPFALLLWTMLAYLAVCEVHAQAHPEARFTRLTTADGLSQSALTAILQDRRGFMWFGTTDGLNRFDGYRFTIYRHDPDDAQTPGSSRIHALFEDQDGILWIGTGGGGLDRFDPHTEAFTHYRHDPADPYSLSGDIVNSITQGRNGTLWVGTQNHGLNRLDPATGRFTRYPVAPDGATNFITDVVEAADGTLWVAATALLHLDPRTGRFTRHHAERIHGIRDLHLDARGVLWVGASQGLARYNPATDALRLFRPAPGVAADASANNVDVIFRDRARRLWLATPTGLYRFDPATETFTHRERHDPAYAGSLSSDRVSTLYEDDAGLLWVGTRDAGLNVLDHRRAQFTHIRHDPTDPNSLPDRHIHALHVDPDGSVWAGSSRGVLTRFDRRRGRFTHYRHDPADPHSISAGHLISAITRDHQGRLWVGGWDAGLNRLDEATGRFRTYRHDPADPHSISANNILSLYVDRAGTLWVGTLYGGLNRFDPATERFHVYRHDPRDSTSLGDDAVSALLEDRQGRLWAGTWGGVLSRLDRATDRFTHFRHHPDDPHSLTQGSIYALYEDRRGVLWVGTAGGLNRFDAATGRFIRYTERDGLPNGSIQGILEDDRGRLWVSTQSGLACLDPATGAVRAFDTADGLPTNEFHTAAFRSPTGELFFGTHDGMVAFFPDRIRTNPYVPPVVLTDFRILNDPVRPGAGILRRAVWATDSLTLTHRNYVVSFTFASLSYDAPEQNRYRYRLEGLEERWNEVGSARRVAMYSNLAPGRYVFRVQGSNSDDVWNREGVTLHIRVLPPWWGTWWFRALLLLLLAGAAVGFYRFRVRAIERHRRALAVQVAERTRALDASNHQLARAKDAAEAANYAKSLFLANMSHELRTPLNAVLGFSELIQQDASIAPTHQEYLGIVRRSGAHLLDLINDVLDMSKAEAGHATLDAEPFDLHALLANLQRPFELRARQQGLDLSFTLAPELPPFVCTDERKLRQVLINLLSNAVKFTERGRVTLHATYDAAHARLRVEVEDTGHGIAPEEAGLVFQAFGQTESGRQSRRGTGLGLPLSRRFVELMGGTLAFESAVGQGSRFWFDVHAPVAEAPARVEAAAAGRHVVGLLPGQPAWRLLVVDDDALNRRLLTELLQGAGFAVRTAADGQQAVDLAATWAPHLIWMDERMPGMSGTEAMQQIRALDRTPPPVIIALTASTHTSAYAREAGYDDYLSKPFRPDVLFETMARHLDVAYRYETRAEPAPAVEAPLAAEELAGLPEALCAALHQAAVRGRPDELEALIRTLPAGHDRLAARLANLVHDFRFDTLIDATRPYAGRPPAGVSR